MAQGYGTLQRTDPGVVATVGSVGGVQMLDTETRCQHQDVRGCQTMADQAFQGFALPSLCSLDRA